MEFLKIRDISKFNPKDVSKSELHKELEENTVSPIVGYLAGLVNNFSPDESIYRENTTTCMSEFKIYYQNNGFKFDYSQAKFNVELTTNFNVRKIKSGGCMYFEFDMKALKKLLETKYKYVFEENTDNTIPQQPNPLDGDPDYKQLYLKQQEELFQLKLQMQELKKSITKAKQQREQTDEGLERELKLLMK